MIFVPMPNRISIRHNKKAGLHYCRSTHLGSGIAFVSKQQHRSPRRTYIYYLRYTPMRVRVYTYHRHLSVAMFCYFQRNLPDFRMPKQSAFKTLLIMSCIPPHFWTPPRRGLQKMYILRCAIREYAAKLQ